MEFEVPHPLQSAIHENKLIVFIGAGVSKIAGLPLWKEIVIKALQDPAVAKGESYVDAINNEVISPLEALDKIRTSNIKEIYKHFELETSITADNPIYSTISKISRKIITTNYDNLIEHNTKIKPIDISSTYSLQKIDSLDEFVLKIHGNCSAIDNAVVFTTDYERLYSEDGLAKFQFEKLISSHSCLFIGFSLSDNYVVKLFDKLNKLYKKLGREHYIITTTSIEHDFVENIKIDSHNYLPEILEALAKHSNQNSPTSSTIEITESEQDNRLTVLLPEDGLKINTGHDTPPKIEHWTGRSEELKSLTISHKVCFITGIGGQGKSALASKLLSEADREKLKFCDWRDFKEEGLNFQTKLFQLIELVSAHKIHTKQLIGLETAALVDIFFEHLEDQKGLFVFDNIDKYIDLQKFTPTGDMAIFFDKALKSPHNSKFVFTCRPFIHYAGIGFYQVQLIGLELSDVQELVKKYHNKLSEQELHKISSRLHIATKGHPLWMGLILAQSRTDILQIEPILRKISARHTPELDLSSMVSETILENVWANLKDREKIVLRTLSISNISETEEDLAKIISKKINYNQFSKALKSLKSLNLIVTKEGSEHLELHPLVREFIKINYGKEEQESYISLYVNYLDGFIVLIKNKLGMVLPPEDLDVIIKKIEVLINTDKIQEAINELRTTSDSFQISGYCEEFLRLSDLLLSKNIWTYKKIITHQGLLDLLDTFFTRSADFGRYEIFDTYIEKYLEVFTTPDANMILAKSAICHRQWSAGNFTEAMKEGKSASDLIDVLGESDSYQGKHRYNLALRDSKIKENIEKALLFFCGTKDLSELLSEDYTNSAPPKYGNIGRSLLFLNRHEEALFLIIKSYKSLNEDSMNFFNQHNLGYASKWIAEILEAQEKYNESLYFLLNARNIWTNDMPIEANKLSAIINKASGTSSEQSIKSLESWQITKFCNDWVTGFYQTTSELYKDKAKIEPTFPLIENL